MPDLGGRSMSDQHARNTARVLNEINPHFIRSRPFVPRHKTPMFEAYQKGEFELTSPHERLQEIRLMIENLQVTCRVCFDHNLNPSYRSGDRLTPLLKQDYNGYQFPEEKEAVLELIDKGIKLDKALPMIEKAVSLDPENGAFLDSYALNFLNVTVSGSLFSCCLRCCMMAVASCTSSVLASILAP